MAETIIKNFSTKMLNFTSTFVNFLLFLNLYDGLITRYHLPKRYCIALIEMAR